MPRRTADIIALVLAVTVAVVVLATTGALLYVKLAHPLQDVAPAADSIGRLVSVLTGALLGYLGGRRVDE